MKECLEEFKQWECNQIWPLDETADIEKLEDEHELILSTNPIVFRNTWSDIRSIFRDAATRLGAAHKRAHPGKPPKRLTSGKHGYRIRKWAK